jgi:hypothetical protein
MGRWPEQSGADGGSWIRASNNDQTMTDVEAVNETKTIRKPMPYCVPALEAMPALNSLGDSEPRGGEAAGRNMKQCECQIAAASSQDTVSGPEVKNEPDQMDRIDAAERRGSVRVKDAEQVRYGEVSFQKRCSRSCGSSGSLT